MVTVWSHFAIEGGSDGIGRGLVILGSDVLVDPHRDRYIGVTESLRDHLHWYSRTQQNSRRRVSSIVQANRSNSCTLNRLSPPPGHGLRMWRQTEFVQ